MVPKKKSALTLHTHNSAKLSQIHNTLCMKNIQTLSIKWMSIHMFFILMLLWNYKMVIFMNMHYAIIKHMCLWHYDVVYDAIMTLNISIHRLDATAQQS